MTEAQLINELLLQPPLPPAVRKRDVAALGVVEAFRRLMERLSREEPTIRSVLVTEAVNDWTWRKMKEEAAQLAREGKTPFPIPLTPPLNITSEELDRQLDCDP